MPWKASKSFDLGHPKERATSYSSPLDQLPLMISTQPSGISTPPESSSAATFPSKAREERHSAPSANYQVKCYSHPRPSKSPSKQNRARTPSADGIHITKIKITPELPAAEVDRRLSTTEDFVQSDPLSPSINYEKNKSVRIVVRDPQTERNEKSPSKRLSKHVREQNNEYSNYTKDKNSSLSSKNHKRSWSVGFPAEIEKTSNEKDLHPIDPWAMCNNGAKPSLLEDQPSSLEDYQRSTSTLVTSKSSKVSGTNEPQRGFLSLATGIGIVIGSAVCLRLPGLLLSYGAGSFLSAFLVCFLLLAIPLAYLESGLGQFSNSGVIGIWSLVPLARGIGWSSVIACLYWGAITVGMTSPWLFYLLAQFSPNSLHLREDWCQSQLNSSTPFDSVNFYRYCLYNLTSTDIGQLDLTLTWSLPTGFIIILVIASFGVAGGPSFLGTLSGISAIFALLGYAIQLIIGVNEIARDNREIVWSSVNVIVNFMLPDGQVLIKPQVWVAAATQALLSLGPGFGLLLNHSAANAFRFPLKRHLWFLAIITLMTTLIVSVTTLVNLSIFTRIDSSVASKEKISPPDSSSVHEGIFSSVENEKLGFCSFSSYKSGALTCEQINLGLAEGFPFISTSQLMKMTKIDTIMHGVAYFAVFLGLLGAGISTTCGCLHVGVMAAREARSIPPTGTAIILMILLSLVAAPTVTKAGSILLHILDYYVLLTGLLWAPLASIIALVLCHGVKKIRKDLTFMLESKVCILWLPIWTVIVPLLLLGLSLWLFVIGWEEFGIMDGLTWKSAAVWALRTGILLPIPITAIIVVKSQLAYGLKDKILSSLQSSREWGEWGPQDPIEHHNWRQWREDETRSYASLDRRLAKARPLTYTHSTLSSTGSSTLTRIRAKYSKNGVAPSML